MLFFFFFFLFFPSTLSPDVIVPIEIVLSVRFPRAIIVIYLTGPLGQIAVRIKWSATD